MKHLLAKCLLVALINATTSCSNKKRDLTKCKKLEDYPKTEFIPSLETKLNKQRNAVYCATLGMAWNAIKKELAPINLFRDTGQLAELNASTVFKNVLKSNEYIISTETGEGYIKAKAQFRKDLPFKEKLSSFKKRFSFMGENIHSFGNMGSIYHTVVILYYKNDSNFIIKLRPKDNNHEIFLSISDAKASNMAGMISDIKEKIAIAAKEREDRKNNWKFYMNSGDELVIPCFNFNIETNFKDIEGDSFLVQNRTHYILQAWQRTGFLLDEKGTIIESEAEMTEATEAMEEEPKIKRMHFNKPFFVVLKRTESNNPYFGMWVANAELMKK